MSMSQYGLSGALVRPGVFPGGDSRLDFDPDLLEEDESGVPEGADIRGVLDRVPLVLVPVDVNRSYAAYAANVEAMLSESCASTAAI